MTLKQCFHCLGWVCLVAAMTTAPAVTFRSTLHPPDIIKPSTKRVATKLALKIYIDSKFSDSHRKAIMGALKEWERATNGMIAFTVGADPWSSDDNFKDVSSPGDDGETVCTTTLHFAAVTSEHKMVKKIDNATEQTIYGYTKAQCAYKYILIVTDRTVSQELTQQTATHELGHALTLEHLRVPYRSIMFPGDLYAARCVTELDVIQLCLDPFFGCDPADMNPCKPGVPLWKKVPQQEE